MLKHYTVKTISKTYENCKCKLKRNYYNFNTFIKLRQEKSHALAW